jgi:hypothetical protein
MTLKEDADHDHSECGPGCVAVTQFIKEYQNDGIEGAILITFSDKEGVGMYTDANYSASPGTMRGMQVCYELIEAIGRQLELLAQNSHIDPILNGGEEGYGTNDDEDDIDDGEEGGWGI